MYTVLLWGNDNWKICFNGRVPILEEKEDCERQVVILNEMFPNNLYKVAKVTFE